MECCTVVCFWVFRSHTPCGRAAGCLLQQMWGSRCTHCGPQHWRASPRKAFGKSPHSPPHGPLPPPDYILEKHNKGLVKWFDECNFLFCIDAGLFERGNRGRTYFESHMHMVMISLEDWQGRSANHSTTSSLTWLHICMLPLPPHIHRQYTSSSKRTH